MTLWSINHEDCQHRKFDENCNSLNFFSHKFHGQWNVPFLLVIEACVPENFFDIGASKLYFKEKKKLRGNDARQKSWILKENDEGERGDQEKNEGETS